MVCYVIDVLLTDAQVYSKHAVQVSFQSTVNYGEAHTIDGDALAEADTVKNHLCIHH
jgi:hypothetical protein